MRGALPEAVAAPGDPLHGLTKPVYTAKEAAALLGLSVHSVYTRIPSMSIGRLRRFTRAAILNVLEHGIEREREPQPEFIAHQGPFQREARAKVLRAKSTETEKPKRPIVSIKEGARMLKILPAKFRELIEQKKIYFSDHGGKKTIPRSAVQY
jgi:hypothetical protein